VKALALILALLTLASVPRASTISVRSAVTLTMVVPESVSGSIIQSGSDLLHPTVLKAQWNVLPDRIVTVRLCEEGACHLVASTQEPYCDGELPCRRLKPQDEVLVATSASEVSLEIEVV